MEKYVPFPLYYDDMPIDISFVFESERPAGKHGFIKTAGDHFEFEDGTKARFWGVNFNGGACFPSHEYSELVAERLEKPDAISSAFTSSTQNGTALIFSLLHAANG